MEHIQAEVEDLHKKQGKKITLVWVPGHEEIEGNEEADEEAAKSITEGNKNSDHMKYLQKLPISRSAARQAMEADLKKRAGDKWQSSPRYQKIRDFDETLPGPSFLRITAKWPRRNTSVLMQLRTGHAQLNGHLHKIGKSATPICPACEMEIETITHFLCICPRYDTHRLKIQRHFRQHVVPKNQLLGDRKAMKVLFEYINKTGCFMQTYGKLDEPKGRQRRRE